MALVFLKVHWREAIVWLVIIAFAAALAVKSVQLLAAKRQIAELKAEIATAAAQIATKHAVAEAVVSDIQQSHQSAIEQVRIEYRTIEKKVPIYVTKYDDAHCVVPDSFGVLWNAQNRGDSAALAESGESFDGTSSRTEHDEPPD